MASSEPWILNFKKPSLPFDPTITQKCFIVFETIFVLITRMRTYGYCRKTGSISDEFDRQSSSLWIPKKLPNAIIRLVGDKKYTTEYYDKRNSVFNDCRQSCLCGGHFGY